MKRKIFLIFLLCLAAVHGMFAVSEAAASKGRVTVFASDGSSVVGDVALEQKSGYARVAETIVKRELRKAGYKVVDAALNNRLKNEAVMALANGDPKLLLEAVKKFQLKYIVSVNLSDNQAIINDFGLYTSSTTVMLQAVSAQTGEYAFDDLVSAKAVGGTKEEAVRRAVEKAALKTCGNLTGGGVL